jgi:soluble lytic murein transglycosylase-like protein
MAAGARDQVRVFVLYIDDQLPSAEEEALLVDLASGYGDPDLAMRAVRTAAQRGFTLPERGYPLLDHLFTPGPGAAETAFVYSISRQESNFDPNARSGPGARGMMQLMPATAAIVARQLGESHSVDRLSDPFYNMRLGSTYLGSMVSNFSGSYIMAAAAYNAGPGRPAAWVGLCGDPRGATTDPLDFIECIPFSETRNYVMRTIETTMVYRARLNGGVAPLTLSSDLKRGGYNYASVERDADGGLPPIGGSPRRSRRAATCRARAKRPLLRFQTPAAPHRPGRRLDQRAVQPEHLARTSGDSASRGAPFRRDAAVSSTRTRSQDRAARPRSCRSRPPPRRLRRLGAQQIQVSNWASGSRPATGSSATSSGARVASKRASSTLARSPPDMSSTPRSARSATPTRSRQSGPPPSAWPRRQIGAPRAATIRAGRFQARRRSCGR